MTDVSAIRVSKRITIGAPPERVWQRAFDFGSGAVWHSTIAQVCLIKDELIAVDSLFLLKQPLQIPDAGGADLWTHIEEFLQSLL